jgi:hypothetical protein
VGKATDMRSRNRWLQVVAVSLDCADKSVAGLQPTVSDETNYWSLTDHCLASVYIQGGMMLLYI